MLIKKNSRNVSHTHELTNAYISLEIFIPTDSVLKSLTFFMNALQKVVTYEKQAQNHEKKTLSQSIIRRLKLPQQVLFHGTSIFNSVLSLAPNGS